MEVDGDYPEEINSFHVNQAQTLDLFSPGKKRKFLAEAQEQHSLPVSKHTCRATLVARNPFSEQSPQDKVFYTHLQKGKELLGKVDDNTHTQGEYTLDSNSTSGDSFSQCNIINGDGYAKASSYDVSSSSSSHLGGATSRDVVCSMNSTLVNGSSDDEVQGDGFHEDNFDEFGHCLAYLAAACDSNNNNNNNEGQTEEELEDILYSNGMISRSGLLSSESLITEKDSQLNKGKATIDQEFEQYFSTLML